MSHKAPTPMPLPVFRGRQIEADYCQQLIPTYQGNPLIEALPPIWQESEAVRLMRRYPEYVPAHRQLPPELRLHLIMNAVQYFEPLPIHLDLESRFSRTIRMGYVGRNPTMQGFWRTLNTQVGCLRSESASADMQTHWPSSMALGFSIVGISGIGKTVSVESILSLYPQVIYHSLYQSQDFSHVQIVWLKIDCPFDGSTRGLCLNFFAAIDNLLHTNYYGNYTRNGQASVDEMLPHMARVAGLHSIGVLVVDEIQHLSQAKSGGWGKMLNFYVQLINIIGMPVVLIGTPKALPILKGEFRQARRGSGQGDLLWDRMPNDGVWRFFVETLWTYQYVQQVCPLTAELSQVLYGESQGITDFAVKLYLLAQI